MGSVSWEVSSSSDKFLKYSFRPEDIEVGAKRIHPENRPEGSGMKRIATPSDKSLRAGFNKLGPGQKIRPWFFWYKEIWFVIAGTGTVKVYDKRTGEKKNTEIKARDFLYFPEGVRVETTNTGNEDLYFLYCAVPASNLYASWLPLMEEEDMEDVRRRKGD